MANRDPERRACTKRRIMDAYWDLYAADPSHSVTVSAVVARAGVHRSTFYEYFADADAVLLAIEDGLAELFETESARALSNGGVDPAGIVRRVYVEHGNKLSLLLGDAGDPRFAKRVKGVLGPVAMGRLGLSGDPFAPYLVEFAVSGLIAAASRWYERDCDLPPDEFGAGVQALLFSVMSQVGAARRAEA